ncbi:hypothetical protein IAD21_03789 [Abditibacteriota bacterium]|nr:hypothetical protein IAD21_03789 [Abditibacteriota bacterium]
MDEQEELAAYAEMQHRVQEARTIVERNIDHDLSFGRVMSILSMFGNRSRQEVLVEDRESALLGWQRRAWNALLCGERISVFWSLTTLQEYLSRKEVEDLRKIDFQQLISKSKRAVILQSEPPIPDLNPTGDDLVYQLSEQSKVSRDVLQAARAYRTLEWAMIIAYTDESNIFDPTITYPEEWNGDWEEVPMAIRASYVVAGRPTGDYLDDPQARREFWLWWLDEAVPASWDLQELNEAWT